MIKNLKIKLQTGEEKMKPTNFNESNIMLGSTNTEIGNLPVYSDGISCISKWKMNWKDRLFALFFGYVWVCIKCGASQPPMWVSAEKTPFDNEKE